MPGRKQREIGMLGWQMFVHSVRLVFANLGAAFRVSLALYAISVAIQYGIQGTLTKSISAGGFDATEMIKATGALKLFVMSLLSVLISIWIAIGWHRYVLLQETPVGWLPVWPGIRILGYFWRTILIFLLIVAVSLVVGFVVGLLAAAIPAFQVFLPFVFIGIGAIGFFRLSPVLPATALGNRMTLRDAWTATSGHNGSILLLALLAVVASVFLQLPTIVSGDPFSLISQIYTVVVGWFATIISVSLLTTIYGHFVEGRPID